MNSQKTNWLAVIVSAVVCFLVGWLWYGVLFQDIWMAGNNITTGPNEMTMIKNGVEIPMSFTPMIVGIISSIVFAWFISWLLGHMGGRSLNKGLQVGLMLGVIMFIGIVSGGLYAANPTNLMMVDGSYSLITWVIAGVVVGGWPQKKTVSENID